MRLSVSVRGSWPARTPPWSQRTVTWQEAFGTTPRHDALRQDALGHDAFCRRGVTVECDLGYRVLVDRIGDRLPHFGIVERLLLRVHRQIAQNDRGRGDHVEVRFGLQRLGLFVGQRISELRLAGLHDGGARIAVDHRLPGDAVHLG